MNKDLVKGLTKEQIAKVKACKNSDEILALAKAEGVELTEEQLTAINGGGACSVVSDVGDFLNPFDCPECGSNKVEAVKGKGNLFECKSCGFRWRE
jgi:predicted RNA-binding Zn-ribbon protein involved in translation (DUF1610 family)